MNLALAVQQQLPNLLAEDNVVSQKVDVRMLERLGYHTDIAPKGFEAQMDDYVSKPVRIDELVAALQRVQTDHES